MRAGYCCRQALAVTAVGLFALVLSGCGGGKKSAAPDSDANLSSLVLSAGMLAPAFSAATTTYSAEVAFAESSVTVTPTAAEDGKATITVNGVPVQSGTASRSISLTVGSNAIAVLVTAADGTTTRTYTVSVKRQEVDAGTWVEISPGTFMMGSPDGSTGVPAELGRYTDEVQHQVTLTHGFVMLSTDVTQGDFDTRMGYKPSNFSTCGDNCPVETVDWHEAAAYCNALSTAAGTAACYTCTPGATLPDVTCTPSTAYATPYACPGYRLPTEAEWEYAARAGTTTATYNGDLDSGHLDCTKPNNVLDPIAWFCGNANLTTHAVGTAGENGGKNARGLYDMLGNVWEWCHDEYDDYRNSAGNACNGTDSCAVTDPVGTGSDRVIRGGSWNFNARDARAAARYGSGPGLRDDGLGFRPVRSLP